MLSPETLAEPFVVFAYVMQVAQDVESKYTTSLSSRDMCHGLVFIKVLLKD